MGNSVYEVWGAVCASPGVPACVCVCLCLRPEGAGVGGGERGCTPSWGIASSCTVLLLAPSPQQWQPRGGGTCNSDRAFVTCDHSSLNSGGGGECIGVQPAPSPCPPGFSRLLTKPWLLQSGPQAPLVENGTTASSSVDSGQVQGVCTQRRPNQPSCC